MTLNDKLDYFVDLFQNNLPGLLSGAGLPDFNEYVKIKEKRSDDLEIVVYPDMEKNITTTDTGSFIIKVQLYKLDKQYTYVDYYDIIKPFIDSNVDAEALGYTYRESFMSDIFPADNRMTSYIYFFLTFTEDLDDCEE